MRKTYRSSNVRFCMEDENQRRTWEYLKCVNRKDGSYGKILSDAFVMVLEARTVGKVYEEEQGSSLQLSKIEKGREEFLREGEKILSEETFRIGMETMVGQMRVCLAEQFSKLQEAFLGQAIEMYEKYASENVSVTNQPVKEVGEEETKQVPDMDMSDAMMSMALAMGE